MVSVYASYAWSEERQNRLVDKLGEACAKRGIYEHRNFRDFRELVHPVVLAGTHLHKPVDRIRFIEH